MFTILLCGGWGWGGTVSEVLKKLVLLLLKVCMLIYAFRNVLISYEKKMFFIFIFYSWH